MISKTLPEAKAETNINAALQLGWGHCVQFCEDGIPTTEGGVKKVITSRDSGAETLIQVKTLEELREVWSEIFLQK